MGILSIQKLVNINENVRQLSTEHTTSYHYGIPDLFFSPAGVSPGRLSAVSNDWCIWIFDMRIFRYSIPKTLYQLILLVYRFFTFTLDRQIPLCKFWFWIIWKVETPFWSFCSWVKQKLMIWSYAWCVKLFDMVYQKILIYWKFLYDWKTHTDKPILVSIPIFSVYWQLG